MKNRIFLASILMGSLVFGSATLFAQDAQSDHGSPEPRMAGVQWAKGEAPTGQAGSSPNLLYHNGPVANSKVTVNAIFWGPSWYNDSFIGDKITGLQAFYTDLSGSNYAGTNTEYIDSNGAHVTSLFSMGAVVKDSSTVTKNFNVTTPILNEVCKLFPSPTAGAYYPVYVDVKRGNRGFCAWHSAGTCNGVQIQFAFFFNLDGDPGCDPQDTSGLHSQGLAALANVSGHEISEMVTDPRLNAWYDSSGAENADKCAWTFGAPLLSFSNGSQWKVQGNWSNAAYNNNQSGYAKGGCIGTK
jgi:hypothetical protein